VMRTPMHDFTGALFRMLMRMDAEAVPTEAGQPTGLNYYGRFRHPAQVKPQTEPSWTQRLEELLREVGYVVEKEWHYPDIAGCSPRNLCDNVITFDDGSSLWLENKGAWKDYWAKQGKVGKFRSHLLESDNSAAHDITKLTPLCAPHARYAGFLLIGFDAPSARISSEVEELRTLAHLLEPVWHEASIHWEDRWRVGNRVHAWFWWRDLLQQK
jgi:hypothetical protein